MGGNRPGNGDRPTLVNRPDFGNLPGRDRPSPGDLNDFLGIHRPGNRPGSRPGFGDRDRPGFGDRDRRPINIGNNVNVGINNRPSWVNIDNDRFTKINNNWRTAIDRRPGGGYGIHNWRNRHPDRVARWRYRGNDIRYRHGHRFHDHFDRDWWYRHRNHDLCGWSYAYGLNNYGFSYWWKYPTSWSTCASWFTWAAPTTVWAQPIYYDYGAGGNVVVENNNVYINDQEVASVEEYAQSAAALATVPPPESEEQAAEAEWMPLGTFAVSTGDDDTDASTTLQLAVSKEGVVSGTLYNSQTDQPRSVQGQVDKETQRVAFRVAGSDKVVIETGLYNLTQSEAPVMVHLGGEQIKYYLLVRLDNPEDQQG